MDHAKAEAKRQLLAGIRSFRESSIYSDLIITCGSDTHKVHKLIVCERASFFARSLRFGGKEADTNRIELVEDEESIVTLMIQYLYEGDYDHELFSKNSEQVIEAPAQDQTPSKRTAKNKTRAPRYIQKQSDPHSCLFDNICDERVCDHHTCKSYGCCQNFVCCICNPPPVGGGPDQMLIHAKMYEIADKYDVLGLKALVITKFDAACKNYWNYSDFSTAAHYAYSTTPDTDKGLRDIIIQTICSHLVELVNKAEVEVLLTEFNGLACGLLKAKIKAGWK